MWNYLLFEVNWTKQRCSVLSVPVCVQWEAKAGSGRPTADTGTRGAADWTQISQRQGQEVCMWGTDTQTHSTERKACDCFESDAVLPVPQTARVLEELRVEQEHIMHLERVKKSLELQMKDMSGRLEEAEQMAMKGGKKIIQKLEGRVNNMQTLFTIKLRRVDFLFILGPMKPFYFHQTLCFPFYFSALFVLWFEVDILSCAYEIKQWINAYFFYRRLFQHSRTPHNKITRQ